MLFKNMWKRILLVVGIFSLFGFAENGWSQGFMVKPMKITLTVRPGQEATQVLELRDTLPETPLSLEVKRLAVKQGENAAWMVDESSGSEGQPADPRSCLPWLTLDTESVDVNPLTSAKVNVKVKAPSNARGVYAAAITAQTKDDPTAQGMRMVVRFLIPVIVVVQGPTARQNLEVLGSRLLYGGGGEEQTSRTLIQVSMKNSGEGFPAVKSSVKVFRAEGAKWRQVLMSPFDERSILPGQSVTFKADPKRSFPSGKYRLVTSGTVDGRPFKELVEEMDYVGDPNAVPLASDVDLVMEPARVECDVVPGGRRTAYLTLRNPTDEPVNVALDAVQVEALKGVMLGETKGDAFSAHAWITVNPAKFTLTKNGQRKVAVQFAFPREGLDKAAYYATLNLAATHPDGKPAGTMQSLILAANKKVTVEPRMYGQALALTQAEKNQYTVSATFANVGGVYLDPSCKGTLMAATGLAAVKSFEMKREPAGLVLPLGTPRWNGTLDFSGVEPGGYTLKVSCEYGAKSGIASFPVKVTDVEGQKQVEVIGETKME
jgi:hypothetical protein